ncbi:MAG: glutamyl-tRNA reductase, partial [Deltaproteobacteria bacterium]|nr:glutamyl-tRNA reductase [Deltaproteobacteria bacterium]
LSHLGPVSDEQRQSLEVLLHSVTQKLLHDPIIFLKRDHSMKKTPHQELNLVRRLFNLDLERETDETDEESD